MYGKKKHVSKYKKKSSPYKKKSKVPYKSKSSAIAKLYRKISHIPRPERKQWNFNMLAGGGSGSGVAYTVGQVNGNNAGWQTWNLTNLGTPSQGTSSTQRVGDQIRLSSTVLNIAMYQQANATQAQRLKFYLIHIKGYPYGASSWPGYAFFNNPCTGIIDWGSQWNTEYMGEYKIIKKWTKIVAPDQGVAGQIMTNTYQVRVKYYGNGHEIGFDPGTTNLQKGQLILFCYADTGNASSSVASTITPIAISGTSTGTNLVMSGTHYFYDN